MNKLFNWTFGSIFRTFGRIIAYLLFGLVIGLIMSKNDIKITDILGLDVVHAAQVPSWLTNSQITMPSNYNISTCSSSSCSNVSTQINHVVDTSGDWYYFFGNTDPLSITANGTLISHNTDTLRPNYMYAYQMYFCSNNDLSLDNTYIDLFGSSTSGGIRQLEHAFSYRGTVVGGGINSAPGNGSTTFNYCFAYRVALSPSEDISWLGLRIKRFGSSNITNTGLYFFGYKIDSLGLYDDYIRTIVTNSIRNSGVATSQELQDATDSINENVNEVNDTITDDDTDGATSDAGDFFSDFTTNTHGLTAVITAPLTAIQSLLDNNHRCHLLQLPIPFVEGNQTIDLPCMSNIYEQHFGDFMYIYHIIIYGIVSYWILVRIFAMVKDFKNPDHDEIEVMEL